MMSQVNIYIYTTIRSPRKCNGAYTYVLETYTSKGPATCTKTEHLHAKTAHQSELCALAAAVKRLYKHCTITIYTDSGFLAAGAEKWMSRWRENGWKNAKGNTVANAEEWKDVACLLNEHEFTFIVGVNHTYYDWMKKEAEKAAGCMK